MTAAFGEYELDTDLSRVQFDRVHTWLTTAYWSPGVPFERVVKAAEFSSIVVSVYHDNCQVGYLRVISDRTTFGWICDVYVDEAHRGRGIAKAMVKFALEHPEHQGMRRWVLATKDAHGVYGECGFEPLKAPSRWMLFGANPSA